MKKSEGSQVDVEAATDATGLKEEGEGLQSQKTVEVQHTSEDTSVNEEPQLRRSSRKRSKTRRWSETSDDDDSKEENAPLRQKQRFETRVGGKTPTGRPVGFNRISTTKKKPEYRPNIDHTALYRPNIDRKS